MEWGSLRFTEDAERWRLKKMMKTRERVCLLSVFFLFELKLMIPRKIGDFNGVGTYSQRRCWGEGDREKSVSGCVYFGPWVRVQLALLWVEP